MLRVDGLVERLDEVMLPSECLHKFKGHSSDRRLNGYAYFWLIDCTDKVRVAHLVTPHQVPTFTEHTLVPAYPRKGTR